MKRKGGISPGTVKMDWLSFLYTYSSGRTLNIGLDVKIHYRLLCGSGPYYGWMIRWVRNRLDQAENAVLNSSYSTWRSIPGSLSTT